MTTSLRATSRGGPSAMFAQSPSIINRSETPKRSGNDVLDNQIVMPDSRKERISRSISASSTALRPPAGSSSISSRGLLTIAEAIIRRFFA